MKRIILPVLLLFFLFQMTSLQAQTGEITMNYKVSMDNPSQHYFCVEFVCEGINKPAIDLKMPAWTPGYYMILDLAKYVVDFQAFNDNGNKLLWEKIDKNTWHVETGNTSVVRINYNVFAYVQTVAHPFLDDGRGFISPTGVFMFVDGYLDHPVNVTVRQKNGWNNISTGLASVDGVPDTWHAENFDELYDCPILAGNLKILSFSVMNIPHFVAMEDMPDIDTTRYINDLRRIVEESVAIIGEIPYKHYTFLVMGEGMGGLEHRNSQAVFSSGRWYSLSDPEGYKSWLAFIAHEYFHLFNVKRIRPVALGPFDYGRENYTNMLWFSEGVTVYYEYLILNRAGILNREDCLKRLQDDIEAYENIPGHLFQSATMSSFDSWIQFFNRSENSSNATISYYDKGSALGMLLDLKIRYETKNEKSLDDVMKNLYWEFYKEKNRGFTDQEFRDVCEKIAGSSLDEIFEYASKTCKIDYPRYLAYAGLGIDTASHLQPGINLGIDTYDRGNSLIISNVVWNSPAWYAGLSPRDTILELNSKKASSSVLNEIIGSGKPGNEVLIRIGRRTGRYNLSIMPGPKKMKTFAITPLSQPDPIQAKLLYNWLTN